MQMGEDAKVRAHERTENEKNRNSWKELVATVAEAYFKSSKKRSGRKTKSVD